LEVTVSTDSGRDENGIPVIDRICTFQVSRNESEAPSSFTIFSFLKMTSFHACSKAAHCPLS